MGCSFSLVDPFETDDGELDGVTSSLSFCLGVEWQLFREREAATRGSFIAQVLSQNTVRILRLLDRRGRRARVTSESDGWSRIEVRAVEVRTPPS